VAKRPKCLKEGGGSGRQAAWKIRVQATESLLTFNMGKEVYATEKKSPARETSRKGGGVRVQVDLVQRGTTPFYDVNQNERKGFFFYEC